LVSAPSNAVVLCIYPMRSTYTVHLYFLDLITVVTKNFGPKRDEVTESWQEVGENCIMKRCMVCTLRPVLLG
jgi:hypothetical protein